MTGAMTRAEAATLNAQGIRTGGCADCIQEALRRDVSTEKDYFLPPGAKTQWRWDELKPDPRAVHRFLCPEHLKRARDE